MKEFNLKCAMIALCLGVLFHLCIPKYEFLDSKTRCNRITGNVEHWSNEYHNRGWN